MFLLFKTFKDSKVDFVYCDYKRFINELIISKADFKTEFLTRDEYYNPDDSSTKTMACGKLYEKSFYENVLLEEKKYFEDEYFYTNIANNIKKGIIHIQKPLYFYRYNLESTMLGVYNDEKLINGAEIFINRLWFFKKINYYHYPAINNCFEYLLNNLLVSNWEKHLVKRTTLLREFAYYKIQFNKANKEFIKYLFVLIFPFSTIFLSFMYLKLRGKK